MKKVVRKTTKPVPVKEVEGENKDLPSNIGTVDCSPIVNIPTPHSGEDNSGDNNPYSDDTPDITVLKAKKDWEDAVKNSQGEQPPIDGWDAPVVSTIVEEEAHLLSTFAEYQTGNKEIAMMLREVGKPDKLLEVFGTGVRILVKAISVER